MPNYAKPPGTASAPCPNCGARHRTWRTLAECRWPKAIWVYGNGRWASVSDCRPAVTVELHPTRESAEQAKRIIDTTACGGRCSRQHLIVDLGEDQ
jgi:hypothetical protein